MKKKIFITTQYMELGGVERSLIGLLDAIDYNLYDVDVFIHRHTGELMPYINTKANLLPEIPAYTTITRSIVSILKDGYFLIALGRLLAKIKFTMKKRAQNDASIFQYVADFTALFLPRITDKKYDLAISFLHPHNIVRSKINAKKKIAWIHTDYSTVSVDIAREYPIWNSFDNIASISESSKDAFCVSFPTLRHKIIVIENMLSSDFVRTQASSEKINLDGEVNLLSVGRYSEPKAFDRAVEICAELVYLGVNIKWYIIGYGNEQPIRDAIEQYKMEKNFILIGKKSNPYPYIKACDIYVQPSRYEGKSVAVREAQMLAKPVVITNYSTANDQLADGIDGIIVSMDVKKAAQGIHSLIKDKSKQKYLIGNTLNKDYGNMSEVEKIYKLIL